MISYLWWALRGFPSGDVSVTALDTDDCNQDLNSIRKEEESMEESLTACLTALRRARAQRQQIEEGYEKLVMSTYDPLEYPIVCRGADSEAPIFTIKEGALNRVEVEVEVDTDDDLSDVSSDFSDEEINKALRPARGTVALTVKPERESESGQLGSELLAASMPSKQKVKVLQLQKLVPTDFSNDDDFSQWREYCGLWDARKSLQSKATRFEVFGRIEEECERLDERLFDLRIRLSNLKAKQKKAEYQIESLVESSTTYDPALTSPAIEMSTMSSQTQSSTMMSLPMSA